MRLYIVPGALDRVHRTSCGHAKRAVEAGRSTTIQGQRADRMLEHLASDPGQMVPSDGANGLPKGYFVPCQVCQPLSGSAS